MVTPRYEDDEDEAYYHLGEGCMVHGDEFMRECPSCGNEFCVKCDGGPLCEECAIDSDELFDDEEERDFEDVEDLDELLADDEEVEKLLADDEDIPEEDLLDEDSDEEDEEEEEEYDEEEEEEEDEY
jgi:hypothetical protein